MSISEEVTAEEARLQRVQELGERVIAHLNEKWGHDPKCPMCGDITWHLAAPVLFPPVPEYEPPGWGSFVVIPVVCSNCGNTLLVNGVKAGVFPPRSEEDGT